MAISTDYIYHMATEIDFLAQTESNMEYFPSTYHLEQFIHATADPLLLLDVANHFYKQSSATDWICLKLAVEKLPTVIYEAPAPVGTIVALDCSQEFKDIVKFPHIYGGIKRDSVVSYHRINRSIEDGSFLCIEGIPSSSSSLPNVELIDIYVDDNNNWSFCDATLYRIPTEPFDHAMLIGRLSSQEDLEELMNKCRQENITLGADEYTNVYVQNGCDDWSGVPWKRFEMPLDVLEYLQQGDTAKTLGRLFCVEDLARLVAKTRDEIKCGVRETLCGNIPRTRPTNTELKECGHQCTISACTACCACLDERVVVDEGSYPVYVDGEGVKAAASRDLYYCHVCNTSLFKEVSNAEAYA